VFFTFSSLTLGENDWQEVTSVGYFLFPKSVGLWEDNRLGSGKIAPLEGRFWLRNERPIPPLPVRHKRIFL
jgi:hypothetical protein